MLRILVIFLLSFLLSPISGAGELITAKAFRTSDKIETSRFVLDLTGHPEYKIFTLESPQRVVIDIQNAKWDNFERPHDDTNRIKSVRYAEKENGLLRVVLDINQSVYVKNDFILKPDESSSVYRLVVDVKPNNEIFDKVSTPAPVSKSGNSFTVPKPKYKKPRKPMIVIDAGHGGHDPGTIGRKKTREKDITLAYAKELRKNLLATGRYKVYMTRDTDKYIALRERVRKARRVKGDLFISLHADAHKNKRTRGLSIYTLSETASDKEAAALARKENKADIINGVDLGASEDEISAVLIDLVQRGTKNLSASLAEDVVANVSKKAKVLRNPHRFAGFRVLTAAEIPSVLIELGYLSNKKEEKLLKSKKHRKKLASAFVQAIDIHFSKYRVTD